MGHTKGGSFAPLPGGGPSTSLTGDIYLIIFYIGMEMQILIFTLWIII